MMPTDDDRLTLGEFVTALRLGLAKRSEVVMWADAKISAIDVPPPWLIDLSLSDQIHCMDLISLLNQLSGHVDPRAVCIRALRRLALTVTDFNQAPAAAARVYSIVGDMLNYDYNDPLMNEATWMSDQFDLVDEGYCSRQQATDDFAAFMHKYLGPSSVNNLPTSQ